MAYNKSACSSAPPNKKEYLTDVGKSLVRKHGKKKFYETEEVKEAAKKTKHYELFNIDWYCWAMATFSARADFDSYHEKTGEV